MSSDDQSQDSALQTFACQRGHELGRTDGTAIWPIHSHISKLVTLQCDVDGCHRRRVWYPPASPTERKT